MQAREHLQNTLLPLIPQFSGEERKNKTRNVSLIDINWFNTFKTWLTENGPIYPGPINNEQLFERIGRNKEEIIVEIDFEVLETNVFNVLISIFNGGPSITRPFMVHPVSKIGRVVINPIKFSVDTDGGIITRTVDPTWTVSEFIVSISEKVNVDPQLLKLRKGRIIISNDISTEEAKNNYGNEVILDLPLSTQINPPMNYGATTSLNCINKSFSANGNNSDVLSIHSSASQPTRAFQIGISSLFHAFIFSLVQQRRIKEYFLSLQNDESILTTTTNTTNTTNTTTSSNNNILQSFLNYVKEVEKHPETLLYPEQFTQDFFTSQPELAITRFFNAATTANNAIMMLMKEAGNNKEISDRFLIKVNKERKCYKCKKISSEEEFIGCVELKVHSKIFRKPSIIDCLNYYLEPKKKEKSEQEKCSLCRKSSKIKETLKFNHIPDILILVLPRFQSGTNEKKCPEVNYPLHLSLTKMTGNYSDNFDLTAVVAHSGHILSQKPKIFIKDCNNAEKWLFYNDSRIIQANQKSAILPSSAVILFYQKCS